MSVVSKKYDLLAPFYDLLWWEYTRATIPRAVTAAALTGHEAICDIGCGTGPLECALFKRYPQLAITACDISLRMIERTKKKLAGKGKVSYVAGDFLHSPLDGQRFHAFFCLGNLHYFPDPAAIFRRAATLAHNDAVLILNSWAYGTRRSKWYAGLMRRIDKGFQRLYTIVEMSQLLADAGWQVEMVEHFSVSGFWTLALLRARKK